MPTRSIASLDQCSSLTLHSPSRRKARRFDNSPCIRDGQRISVIEHFLRDLHHEHWCIDAALRTARSTLIAQYCLSAFRAAHWGT